MAPNQPFGPLAAQQTASQIKIPTVVVRTLLFHYETYFAAAIFDRHVR